MTARVVGVIPARYGSSRLPGKPLRTIGGRPLIEHVVNRCRAAQGLEAVLVATDDERIAETVRGFGGEAVMTRADHVSGTDRLAEVAERIDAEIVVNIQGDQPFLDPVMIDEVIAPLIADPTAPVSTLIHPIHRDEDLMDPGVVKTVVDLKGNALYFSRSLIPYPREKVAHAVYEHVGVYAYRRETLIELARLPATTLERVESLEQLRWLEHGIRICVVESRCRDHAFSGFSVDTPEDLERAERMLAEYEAGIGGMRQ